jgi:hypothetical protein
MTTAIVGLLVARRVCGPRLDIDPDARATPFYPGGRTSRFSG